MKILYLINQYPKVSHTFIRREILAVEKQGVQVQRVAMHCDDPAQMSEIDKSEHAKTHYVLQQSKLTLILQFLQAMLGKPKLFFKALRVMFVMNKASKESVLKHLIYVLESCDVAALCKKSGATHIHAHFGTNPAEVAMYSSILSGVPYSFTMHGSEEFDKPYTLNLSEKIKHASKVIAISHYSQSQVYRWTQYHEWHKVDIVHCALEAEFFDDSLLERPKRNTATKFLCIGRLCEQKGQLLLLEAFKRFIQGGQDGYLTLAGDGEKRAEVEQYIEMHQLQSHVTITGWIDTHQIRELLNDSDAMLLPSFAEGLPVAVMEAMATGVPVISTAITGIPEIVKHNETGFLVYPGSVDALHEALVDFVEISDNKLIEIKSAAYKTVVEEYNSDTEAAKFIKILGAIT